MELQKRKLFYNITHNIVTWCLKAGVVKLEQMFTASQRLGERIHKHYKNRCPLLHNGSSYCDSLHAV
jgi:hypothetical protein